MKKTLAFIASLMLMTTAFVSCGNTDDDDDSSGKRSKSSSSVDRSDDDDDDNKSSKKDKDNDDDDNKSSKKDKDDEDDDNDKKSSQKDKDDDEDDSKPSDKSGGDITGTWECDGSSAAQFFGDIDEFRLQSMTFDISEDDITIKMSLDLSEVFCFNGDKFNMYGEDMDYGYDGKTIAITYMGETFTEFKRVGKADMDSVYGEYTNDDMSDGFGDGDMTIDFADDNVTYAVVSMTMKSSYDEETGKLTVTGLDGEVEDMDVEISGDKMYMTDEDGEQVTFIRKK